MLDPVKNAKTIAFLLIIVGVLNTFLGLVRFTDTDPLSALIKLGSGILYLAVGFGLRKTKLWAVYALGISALIEFGFLIFSLVGGEELSLVSVISIAITVALFVWFYSAKGRFSK